jgi:hypothetical protein
MSDWTLNQALDRCPFRSVVSPSGRLEPILGAWAIVKGPALPMPKAAIDDAAEAFRRGGSFLILAANRADRDAAKAALLLRFKPAEGRA